MNKRRNSTSSKGVEWKKYLENVITQKMTKNDITGVFEDNLKWRRLLIHWQTELT